MKRGDTWVLEFPFKGDPSHVTDASDFKMQMRDSSGYVVYTHETFLAAERVLSEKNMLTLTIPAVSNNLLGIGSYKADVEITTGTVVVSTDTLSITCDADVTRTGS